MSGSQLLTGSNFPMWVETLGSLPDNVVSVAPEGGYVKWDGTQWVHDAEAEKAFFQGQAAQEKAKQCRGWLESALFIPQLKIIYL